MTRIKRNVRASQLYAVSCPMDDECVVELALELTGRAVARVRDSD